MSKIDPLSNVDLAWLRMEDPTNLMMVTGILTFEDRIDIQRLRAVLEQRLLAFDRFRMRVVDPQKLLLPAYWEEDPTFDMNSHLHLLALPEPAGHDELQNLASDLMSTPLDYSKPLWNVHVVENFGEGSAVIVRLHHCIADGMALVYVLLSMTDFGPDGAPAASEASIGPARPTVAKNGGMTTAVLKRSSKLLSNSRSLTQRIFAESKEILVNPARAVELALAGGDNAFAAARLLLRSNDPITLFKGSLGVSKRAAWSRPLPLKDVKAIKNITGATINDVLVSALSGGLRRYMIARGEPVEGIEFRAGVPINMRTPEEMGTLGNKFGLLFLTLPVNIGDPLDRLAVVHERMGELKNSKEGSVGLMVLSGLGMTPNEIQDEIVSLFAAKITSVLTNVPGPPMPLYLAGSKIDGIMFWVPQSGRVGLGISILSYANKVYVGVATDSGLVPDPDRIIEGFYKEFDDLLELVAQAEEIEAES